MRKLILFATAVLVLLVAGRNQFDFLYDEVLDGPFRLVAVDVHEGMLLCRTANMDGDCVGDGLAGGPTVFQVGWDARYIVAARHPRKWPEPPNRSITEFYYIVRSSTDVDVIRPVNQKGPFDEAQFKVEKERLQLPEFARVIQRLK